MIASFIQGEIARSSWIKVNQQNQADVEMAKLSSWNRNHSNWNCRKERGETSVDNRQIFVLPKLNEVITNRKKEEWFYHLLNSYVLFNQGILANFNSEINWPSFFQYLFILRNNLKLDEINVYRWSCHFQCLLPPLCWMKQPLNEFSLTSISPSSICRRN